jgi:hypothetical protein
MGMFPNGFFRARRAGGWLLLAAFSLAGCAGAGLSRACHQGELPGIMDSLYFGTSMPDGQVSAEDWQRFLSEIITPRFPEGLTSWAAAGQWQDGAGKLEKESSYVLHVVHPDSAKTDVAVNEVISIYKSRFHQQAVLRVRSPACISF